MISDGKTRLVITLNNSTYDSFCASAKSLNLTKSSFAEILFQSVLAEDKSVSDIAFNFCESVINQQPKNNTNV